MNFKVSAKFEIEADTKEQAMEIFEGWVADMTTNGDYLIDHFTVSEGEKA